MPKFNGQNKKKINPRYFSEELLEETGTRKEEIQRTLKEQTRNGYAGQRPPVADDGDGEDRREKGPGRTRGEEAAFQALRNTQEWAKQLTPVKYRQLIQDVQGAMKYLFRASPSAERVGMVKYFGGKIQKYAAAAMKGKVTAQQAAKFEEELRKELEAGLERGGLGTPVLDSGYPGVHTA